jgi:hypothetical protein
MRTDGPKAAPKFFSIEQITECVEASTRTVRRWIEECTPTLNLDDPTLSASFEEQ